MSAVDASGEEKYFIDGVTFEGIRNQSIANDGEITFFEGRSEQHLFPSTNLDTGKFFLLFE